MREKFFIKTKFDQKILRKKRGESYDKNKFTAIYLRKSIPPQKEENNPGGRYCAYRSRQPKQA
jgi:hypothetical protein